MSSLSYTAASNRISTSGYEYDLSGNMIRGQNDSGMWLRFEYDAAGRKVKIKDDSSNVLETYYYAADRNRLINETSSQRTYYCWGGSNPLIEYIENSSSPSALVYSKSYVYAGSRLLSMATNNSGTETLEFQHPARLGTKLITNPTSATHFEQATLPFGTPLAAETSGTTKSVMVKKNKRENSPPPLIFDF